MSPGRAIVVAALLSVILPMAEAQPRRIVSTTPSITETLYALGLGDRVVGVTNYCHYPPEVVTKPKIGTYTAPNLEAIAALRPDLVILQTNPIQLQSKLAALKLKTLEINQESLPKLMDSIRQIATATGTSAKGAELISKLQGGLDSIATKLKGAPRTRTMFLIGRSPNALDGMVAAGGHTFLNELIDLAGGENIFKVAVAAYPTISLEEVLSRSPAVIIDMGDMAQTVGVTDAHKRGVVKLWSRYQTIEAVRKGRVFAVASDIFVVPGPRIVEAVREFARMLHPEAGL